MTRTSSKSIGQRSPSICLRARLLLTALHSVSAYFGDLKDGVHKGDENDPRVSIIEVIPDEIRYWVATQGTVRRAVGVAISAATGKAARPGEIRTITKEEVRCRRTVQPSEMIDPLLDYAHTRTAYKGRVRRRREWRPCTCSTTLYDLTETMIFEFLNPAINSYEHLEHAFFLFRSYCVEFHVACPWPAHCHRCGKHPSSFLPLRGICTDLFKYV
jgi:hypothetical protein